MEERADIADHSFVAPVRRLRDYVEVVPACLSVDTDLERVVAGDVVCGRRDGDCEEGLDVREPVANQGSGSARLIIVGMALKAHSLREFVWQLADVWFFLMFSTLNS